MGPTEVESPPTVTSPEVTQPLDAPKPLRMAIELSQVTKSYGSVQAVRGIDLAVAPGETVALLGPNGAGKSTTIDMILGLSRPDSGTVSVLGVLPAEAVKSGRVGGTLQDGRAVAERGKTILFATHYLEEADANADRIVLMARGRIVADGPATEIKAKVGTRTIRATLPAVDLADLQALPGVLSAERRGDAITLSCSDTDAALSALLRSFPGARDTEVRGASLEEAFLKLTVDEDDHDDRDAIGEPSSPEGEESR